jgi:tubulin polyglutamylase TTLL6/13
MIFLVSQAVDVSGFYISPDPDFTSNLLWTDTLISMDIVSALKPYQKVNHFPTMNEISRKDLLAKNYDR